MKKPILLILSILISTSGFGQSNGAMAPRFSYGVSAGLDPLTSPGRYSSKALSKLNKRDVRNFEAILYNPNWQQGYVIIDEETKSNTLLLQYSVYSNELLFVENGKKHTVRPDQIRGFVLIDNYKETRFKNGFTSQEYDIHPEQLMRVIYEGKIKLLAKEDAILVDHIAPRISRQTTYYLVTPHNNLRKVELNETDIIEAVDIKRDKLIGYAVNNNLDFNNESDLKKILSYYEKI